MNNNYTTIDNKIFELGLSVKAIGLYLIVKDMIQEGERVSLKDICNKSNEGMTLVRNAMNELIESGVIERNSLRGNNGGFNGYEYKIRM